MSAVLPGVAIAISLVPPLGVVGVCAGQGNLAMASWCRSRIEVESPGATPSISALLDALDGTVPDGIAIVINTSVGEQIDAGVVGQSAQG